MSRFKKGQSGNPNGRPRKRRPDVSAFDILIDKRLTVIQGGVERELTVEEALELQTYQAAIGGSRMATRAILKMIEKREIALAAKNPVRNKPIDVKHQHTSDNARRALEILDIAIPDPDLPSLPADKRRMMLRLWATQAALGRASRKSLTPKDIQDIEFFTLDAKELRWPKGMGR